MGVVCRGKIRGGWMCLTGLFEGLVDRYLARGTIADLGNRVADSCKQSWSKTEVCLRGSRKATPHCSLPTHQIGASFAGK